MTTTATGAPGRSPRSRDELRRELTTRHITFIALGAAVGTGLFYGSAGGIQAAGPGVILAFLLAGAAVFMVMRALGEMALREPVPGSFVSYATRYLSPFAGYLTGWTYVFEVAVVIVADTMAVTAYMAFWYPHVPAWVWVAATMAMLGVVNLSRVGNFGEAEFWFALIKVLAIVAMILGGAFLMVTGVSYQDGTVSGLHNLVDHGGFLPHGPLSVLTALTIVTFAFGGTETVAVAAGEAKDPARAIPQAVNAVPVRILLFYVGSMVVIMALAPWTSVDGESSPFVQIFQALQIPLAPHILNFVVLTAAVSAINACIYTGGRLLFAMAQEGHAPRVFTSVNRRGVPWASVGAALVVMAGGAVIITLYEDAFAVVAGVATFAVLFTWAVILLSHRSMRRELRAAGERPPSFTMPGGAVGTWLVLGFIATVTLTMALDERSRQPLLIGLAWVAVLTAVWIGSGAHRAGGFPARDHGSRPRRV